MKMYDSLFSLFRSHCTNNLSTECSQKLVTNLFNTNIVVYKKNLVNFQFIKQKLTNKTCTDQNSTKLFQTKNYKNEFINIQRMMFLLENYKQNMHWSKFNENSSH